eukprot:COSAG02_NODE_526_length_20707_cov_11.431337_8_plen_137_part_00
MVLEARATATSGRTSNQQPELHSTGTISETSADIDLTGSRSTEGVDESDVAKLVEMGFPTARVVQRLVANGGNFDAAMVALLSDTDAEQQMDVASSNRERGDEVEATQSGMMLIQQALHACLQLCVVCVHGTYQYE